MRVPRRSWASRNWRLNAGPQSSSKDERDLAAGAGRSRLDGAQAAVPHGKLRTKLRILFNFFASHFGEVDTIGQTRDIDVRLHGITGVITRTGHGVRPAYPSGVLIWSSSDVGRRTFGLDSTLAAASLQTAHLGAVE